MGNAQEAACVLSHWVDVDPFCRKPDGETGAKKTESEGLEGEKNAQKESEAGPAKPDVLDFTNLQSTPTQTANDDAGGGQTSLFPAPRAPQPSYLGPAPKPLEKSDSEFSVLPILAGEPRTDNGSAEPWAVGMGTLRAGYAAPDGAFKARLDASRDFGSRQRSLVGDLELSGMAADPNDVAQKDQGSAALTNTDDASKKKPQDSYKVHLTAGRIFYDEGSGETKIGGDVAASLRGNEFLLNGSAILPDSVETGAADLANDSAPGSATGPNVSGSMSFKSGGNSFGVEMGRNRDRDSFGLKFEPGGNSFKFLSERSPQTQGELRAGLDFSLPELGGSPLDLEGKLGSTFKVGGKYRILGTPEKAKATDAAGGASKAAETDAPAPELGQVRASLAGFDDGMIFGLGGKAALGKDTSASSISGDLSYNLGKGRLGNSSLLAEWPSGITASPDRFQLKYDADTALGDSLSAESRLRLGDVRLNADGRYNLRSNEVMGAGLSVGSALGPPTDIGWLLGTRFDGTGERNDLSIAGTFLGSELYGQGRAQMDLNSGQITSVGLSGGYLPKGGGTLLGARGSLAYEAGKVGTQPPPGQPRDDGSDATTDSGAAPTPPVGPSLSAGALVDLKLTQEQVLRLSGSLKLGADGLSAAGVYATQGMKLKDGMMLLTEAGVLTEQQGNELVTGLSLGVGIQIEEQPVIVRLQTVGNESRVAVGLPIPLPMPGK
ncbi:MAG: hypothetical protein U1A78_37195 [Polyangia bacterium]